MSYLANQQVIILKEGSSRNRGKDAQRGNISAARIVSEVVKTTLGPRGMDKMMVDSLGDVTITSDGATVLDELDVQHPAAKMLVEVAKTQDDEVGDGTTTSVVLAGELLKRAEFLLDQGVHPTVINAGYKKAGERRSRPRSSPEMRIRVLLKFAKILMLSRLRNHRSRRRICG